MRSLFRRGAHLRAPDRKSLGQQVKSGFGWSFANNAFGKSVSLLSGIVLARILVPRDFGVFAIATVVLTLLASVNDMGVTATVVRWPGDLDPVGPTATTVVFGLSALGYLVFFAVAPYYASAFHAPQSTTLLRVLATAILIDGLTAVCGAVLTRTFRQDKRAIADTTGLVISTIVSIVLALHGYGVWSLVWGRLIGNVITAGLNFVFTPVRYRPGFRWEAARGLLGYGLPLAGSTLLFVAVLNVDYLTVGRVLGPIALGFYAIAFNVSSWPFNILSIPVQQVSIPGFAKLQDNREAVGKAFVRAATLLAVITVPVCVLASSLGHAVLSVIYGQRWTPAAGALRFLALFTIIRIAQSLSWDALVAVGKARTTLWLQAAWLVALVPALIAGAKVDGIRGVAIGHLAVGACVVIPLYLFALHGMGVRIKALGQHLAWVGVGGLLAGFAAWSVTLAVSSGVVQLVAGTLVGLLVFGVSILPMRRYIGSSRDPEVLKPPATDEGGAEWPAEEGAIAPVSPSSRVV